MKIIKRNGSEMAFDIDKIIIAISKANKTVGENERMTPMQIQRIAESVVLSCEKLGRSPSVEEVQAVSYTHLDVYKRQEKGSGLMNLSGKIVTRFPEGYMWTN